MYRPETAPSLRSLTALQPVPPPKHPSLGAIDTDLQQWDPFPEEARDPPYAPHAETRDAHECRQAASDERCGREGAESVREGHPGPTREAARISASAPSRRLTHKARPHLDTIAASTPPRNSQPRHLSNLSVYSDSPRRRSRSRSSKGTSSSDRSRSSTPLKNNKREGLIKVATDGSLTKDGKKELRRSRHRSESPMLTRGRVDLLDKETDGKVDKSVGLDGSAKRSVDRSSRASTKQGKRDLSSSSPKPTNAEGAKSRVFMVGTSRVYSRTLIPPTVYHNTATDNWIVTINTGSKLSSKITNSTHSNKGNGQKAFSFRTEKEARASAYANAPPVMIPFDSCKECMLCSTKFTLFKRPRHCRNCGICICSSYGCSTSWSKLMIPETFNSKKQSAVNVCTSCNSLSKRFKHALLNGRYGTAVELYLTGNVNLRVPFVPKDKGKEAMFPIHAAIEGESEKLLRWLVDVQHCPLHVISTGNAKSSGLGAVVGAGADMLKSLNDSLSTKPQKKNMYTPTLKTSQGRSVMDVAMKTKHVGILRYLINEKNCSVYEVEELELALGAAEALAKAFPAVDGSFDPGMYEEKTKQGSSVDVSTKSGGTGEKDASDGNGVGKSKSGERAAAKSTTKRKETGREEPSPKKEAIRSHAFLPPPKEGMLLQRDVHGVPVRELYGAIGGYDGHRDDSVGSEEGDEEQVTILLDDDASVVSTTVPDACLLCRERAVDCVATPCGHQMCCLECSNQILRCPICELECHFIEIYQP